MESKSHTKYETEFFLKLYVDQKCCEANFKKTQNYEISDSLVFPSPSQGRQEDRVQGVHSVAGPPRRIGTRKSLWRTSVKVIIHFICFVYIYWWIPCSLILKIITKLIHNVKTPGKRQSRWLIYIKCIFHLCCLKMIEFHSNSVYIFAVWKYNILRASSCFDDCC